MKGSADHMFLLIGHGGRAVLQHGVRSLFFCVSEMIWISVLSSIGIHP